MCGVGMFSSGKGHDSSRPPRFRSPIHLNSLEMANFKSLQP